MEYPSPSLNLIIESENPYNTNMYDEQDGRILYQVMTESTPDAVTQVRNIDGETIASWQWREPRAITFASGYPVPLGSWLKKSIMPFKDSVTFQDQVGRHFKWKGLGTGLPLELFSEDDKKNPVACFVRSHVLPSMPSGTWTSPSGPYRVKARLSVDQRGREILDLIVISFLLLDKHRRTTESPTAIGSTNHSPNLRSRHATV
ncbi:hypothetical protein GYMLUDRAFT_499412 [Collybiopsis luxurians FD-317 M1]|uniref:DUF6593 domain-containing protein n=1 Tax=Collybiopsis luxurians FD-317 M1 TaxID=944289 RepID=A0A0D0BF69_9AGAR|nr:hypothetical protein GYMLUDRAFT_499412 [Collybiopsis luxurians FD-317 M1]